MSWPSRDGVFVGREGALSLFLYGISRQEARQGESKRVGSSIWFPVPHPVHESDSRMSGRANGGSTFDTFSLVLSCLLTLYTSVLESFPFTTPLDGG